MTSPRWTDELQFFVLTGLIGMGLFTEFDRLPGWLAVGLMALMFLLGWPKKTPSNSKKKNQALPAFGKLNLFVSIVALAPAVLAWALNSNSEFPFSGDHDHHVFAAQAALTYWKKLFWVPLLWFGFGIWYLKSHHRLKLFRFWGAAVLLAFWILGASFQVPEHYFARYPAFGYLVTFPFSLLAESFKMTNLLWASQTAQFASLPVWLLFLRPLFLRRWPGWRILPFVLLLFWQKDFLYYQTSAYLEPWSLIFIFLGLEMALTTDQPKWRSFLLLASSLWFKETSVLLLPFFWLGLYAAPLFQGRNRILLKESVLTGAAGLAPFAVYYALRVQEKIWRQTSIGDVSGALTSPRFQEFCERFFAQWQAGGILVLLLTGGAWVLLFKEKRQLRPLFLSLLTATLFLFAFYFVDFLSRSYTGYARFHLPAYALFASVWLVFADSSLFQKKRLYAMTAVFSVLQLSALIGYFNLLLGPPSRLSFLEHHNMPIYFPIRDLLEEGQRLKTINPGDPIVVLSPIPNLYPQSLHAGYRDLYSRYKLKVARVPSDPRLCACTAQNPVFLLLQTTGPRSGSANQDCVGELKRSCQSVIERFQPDGQLTGILASSREGLERK